MQNSSAAIPDLLEDYPNCGIRNNDTFTYDPLDPNYVGPYFGSESTADWSVECLWDCTWKESPYVSTVYTINLSDSDLLNITLFMPKVPVDLRCLDGCTDTQVSRIIDVFEDNICKNSELGPFLGCYIYRYENENIGQDYFYLAVESCILAILEPSFYSGRNCDQLKVNLRIFTPYNPPSYLYTSYSSNITKLQGPASDDVTAFAGVLNKQLPTKNRYPWLCSLRTPGYRGVHKCGVTLLSGPPKPTIFVSAAHCNYLCKDELGRVVELCCCRESQSEFSCSSNDFCGTNPSLQEANPRDLQIVCNIRSQKVVPQGIGYPNATILNIKEIRNHPNYMALSKSSEGEGGPIAGYDISVYIVYDNNLASRMNTSSIWPACLPRAEAAYMSGNRGILAGWNEPQPTYLEASNTIESYNIENFVIREALLEKQDFCADPKWMRSNTYYPLGTLCYEDAAWASSVQFGTSGSGLVRPFTTADGNQIRYSWVGPLSLSKGSDRVQFDNGTLFDNSRQVTYSTLVDYNSNPAVFTDARCYLDWIAAQYELRLPADYTKPTSCDMENGDKTAANNFNCLSRPLDAQFYASSNKPEKCLFIPGKFEKCKLYAFDRDAKPAFNLNFYYCQTARGYDAVCANDCPGVDPNAVVVGGEAALLSIAVAAVGGPNLLGPILGAGVGLAGLGLGGVAMTRNRTAASCPARQCRSTVSRQCCDLVFINGRQLCPRFC